MHRNTYMQGCTNPMYQVVKAVKFCMMVPYICGSSIMLQITLLALRILRLPLYFLEKFYIPPYMN